MSDVVIVYFVVGVIMVGGGALDLSDAGIANFFVEEEDDGEFTGGTDPSGQIDDTDSAVQTVVSLAVGGALLVWNFIKGLFVYLFWPLVTLYQVGAPPMATLLIGGGFTTAFYLGIAGMLWRAT